MKVSLSELGIVNALGNTPDEVWENLHESPESGLTQSDWVIGRDPIPVGSVTVELPTIPDRLSHLDCRNNRLAMAALTRMESTVHELVAKHGPSRVGVVAGTSTSGIRSAEKAIDSWMEDGSLPEEFHYNQMEMGGLSRFVKEYFELRGPSYTVSTSCSSSAKVFASGRSLLVRDEVDAVIVGGADSLCQLTLNGFNSLQLLSAKRCNPMAENRNGINIGEGSAFFVMQRGTGPVEVAGVGESSDAHSMNAPDPDGKGAETSMRKALEQAEITPDDLDYLNLHGTATRQNDAMESKAVERVFDRELPCSSTKAYMGHTLGAAGALETAVCWMMLDRANGEGLPLVPHLWEGPYDEELPRLNLVQNSRVGEATPPHFLMTNSFAFGGHNCSVVLGGRREA